jgi:hypothetical protein
VLFPFGTPADQSPLVFQFAVPDAGPTQLSVHVVAAAGLAAAEVAPASTTVTASQVAGSMSAAAARRLPVPM